MREETPKQKRYDIALFIVGLAACAVFIAAMGTLFFWTGEPQNGKERGKYDTELQAMVSGQ